MSTSDLEPLFYKHLSPHGTDDPEYLIGDFTPLVGYYDCHAINVPFVCNAPPTGIATQFMLAMIRRWEQLSNNLISRIEFLSHPGNERHAGLRGAVLYDSHLQPVFHLVNALLGYAGSGSYLSIDVMKALGMSSSKAERINDENETLQKHKVPYCVIVYMDDADEYEWHSRTVMLDQQPR